MEILREEGLGTICPLVTGAGGSPPDGTPTLAVARFHCAGVILIALKTFGNRLVKYRYPTNRIPVIKTTVPPFPPVFMFTFGGTVVSSLWRTEPPIL